MLGSHFHFRDGEGLSELSQLGPAIGPDWTDEILVFAGEWDSYPLQQAQREQGWAEEVGIHLVLTLACFALSGYL